MHEVVWKSNIFGLEANSVYLNSNGHYMRELLWQQIVKQFTNFGQMTGLRTVLKVLLLTVSLSHVNIIIACGAKIIWRHLRTSSDFLD